MSYSAHMHHILLKIFYHKLTGCRDIEKAEETVQVGKRYWGKVSVWWCISEERKESVAQIDADEEEEDKVMVVAEVTSERARKKCS